MQNQYVKEANKVKINKTIEKLQQRFINGYYTETKEEACKLAVSFITEEDKVVAWGGSQTLDQVGVKEEIAKLDVEIIDQYDFKTRAEALDKRRKALHTDVYFMSSNAVTLDGELVNVDGTCNRIAALCFGPKKVVLIVGVNKLADNLTEAFAKVQRDACMANAIRLERHKVPCRHTGRCGDCKIEGETMCSNWVITRFSAFPDRMHVIFVNEELGF